MIYDFSLACMHPCMHVSVCVCVCACVCVHACMHACVCVRACVHACMRVSVCVCVCVWLLWGHCRVTQAGRRKLPVNPNLFLFFSGCRRPVWLDWQLHATHKRCENMHVFMVVFVCCFLSLFFSLFFFFNITIHIISDNVCFCFNHLVCFL